MLALLSFRKLKEEQREQWQGGILLIDEIDATLHPAAQSKLTKLFIQEAKENKLQIVLTTHSLSFLKDICGRTAYNSHDESVNNKVELYYLTNANRKLEIKRNTPFTEIESDLMVNSIVQIVIKSNCIRKMPRRVGFYRILSATIYHMLRSWM